MEVRFKNFVSIRGSYTQQGLSNHFQADQIWCDGTFKKKSLKYVLVFITGI